MLPEMQIVIRSGCRTVAAHIAPEPFRLLMDNFVMLSKKVTLAEQRLALFAFIPN